MEVQCPRADGALRAACVWRAPRCPGSCAGLSHRKCPADGLVISQGWATPVAVKAEMLCPGPLWPWLCSHVAFMTSASPPPGGRITNVASSRDGERESE